MTVAAIENTLEYDSEKCVNCLLCIYVCPHEVFAPNGKVVALANAEDCMECGACRVNCPTDAIRVDSGVGCAYAMMYASITGGKEVCGPADDGDTSGGGCC